MKRKEIEADERVPCVLDTENSATEISLAEDAVRAADQYEEFRGPKGFRVEKLGGARE